MESPKTPTRPTGDGPDQGWAWVVAVACFTINVIMAGLARTAGVLYVALIDLYGVSRESATTPFSVRVCVRNMTGPLIGLLGQRYGIRPITVMGSIFAGVGGMLCFVAPNVFWITVFWGIIHGVGFGLTTVLHMMTIHQYFDKYKASAMGFGFSGDCVGTFLFPILIEFLIDSYGIKGTFLILGGIVMNVLPAALLLRPPPWIVESGIRSAQASSGNLKSSAPSSDPTEEPVFNQWKILGYYRISPSSMAAHQATGRADDVVLKSCRLVCVRTNPELVPDVKLCASNCTFPDKSQKPSQTPEAPSALGTVLSVSLNPMFNLISLTMAVYAFLFVTVLTIIIDFAVDKGISLQQGKYLVIGFSAADLVGRLSFGGIMDRKWLSLYSYAMVTVTAMGGLVTTIPWCPNFEALMGVMLSYGLVQGGSAIMFPILIGNYMKKEEENIAMGCMNFYGGIVMLGMAPMIGFFRDQYGSYDSIFYIIGGMTALTGCLWLLEPLIMRCWNERLREESVTPAAVISSPEKA